MKLIIWGFNMTDNIGIIFRRVKTATKQMNESPNDPVVCKNAAYVLVDFVDLISKYEVFTFMASRFKATQNAYDFWDNFAKNDCKKIHICDISLEDLRKKHSNVLSLTKKI